jgi:hypothetical protein
MKGWRARALLVWLACIVIAAVIVIRARYITDLSAFLPDKPTATQQLLVDQLRDGPASRLILIAIEGADADKRAKLSKTLAAALRRDSRFARVENGEPVTEQGDREFLFSHRYLLSDQVNAERFTPAGLHEAIADSIADLASPTGLLFKSLLPRDPTGELLHIVDQLSSIAAPETRQDQIGRDALVSHQRSIGGGLAARRLSFPDGARIRASARGERRRGGRRGGGVGIRRGTWTHPWLWNNVDRRVGRLFNLFFHSIAPAARGRRRRDLLAAALVADRAFGNAHLGLRIRLVVAIRLSGA